MNIKKYNQEGGKRISSVIFPVSYNLNKLFFTILYSLCLILSLISFIWNVDVLIKVNALLGMLAFMLLSIRIKREYIMIYVYMGLLVMSFFVSSLFVVRTDWRLFTPILFMISGFGTAMILLKGCVYSWGGYIVFYSLAGYFLILMFAGVSGYSALQFCSFNGISMVMLVACISLYIILSMEKKKLI